MKNGKKRNSGSFSKDKQPPAASKRKKKKKTVLREAIGLDSWESIQGYLLEKGAKKFIKELHRLSGRSFVVSYTDALEFFKPKLARTEHTGDKGGPIKHEHGIDYSRFTDEELAAIAALADKGAAGVSTP